jgi:hypothetical protein
MFSRLFGKAAAPRQTLLGDFAEALLTIELSIFEAANTHGRPDIVYNLRLNTRAQPVIYGFAMFVAYEALSFKFPDAAFDASAKRQLDEEWTSYGDYMVATFYNAYRGKFGEEAARSDYEEVKNLIFDRYREIAETYTGLVSSRLAAGEKYKEATRTAWLAILETVAKNISGPEEKPVDERILAQLLSDAHKALHKLSSTLKAA